MTMSDCFFVIVTFFEILVTHLSFDGKCEALYRMCIAFTIVTSHQDVQITFYRVACRMDPRLRGDDSLRERISKTR